MSLTRHDDILVFFSQFLNLFVPDSTPETLHIVLVPTSGRPFLLLAGIVLVTGSLTPLFREISPMLARILFFFDGRQLHLTPPPKWCRNGRPQSPWGRHWDLSFGHVQTWQEWGYARGTTY